MSRRDLRLLLEDILECSNKIIKYTAGLTYEEFLLDDMTIDATVRNLRSLTKQPIAFRKISRSNTQKSIG